MIKDKKETLIEIISYRKKLQNREDTDPAYLTNSIKELRHWIMYTHLRIEQTIQIILAQNIFRLELKRKNAPLIVDSFSRVAPIFDNMEFYPKIKAIQSLNLLPKEIINLILKVNDHRKYFSHPATYQKEINTYKEPEKELITLKELDKVLYELDQYIIKNKLLIDLND